MRPLPRQWNETIFWYCTGHGNFITVGHRRRVTAGTRLPWWRRRKTRLQVTPLSKEAGDPTTKYNWEAIVFNVPFFLNYCQYVCVLWIALFIQHLASIILETTMNICSSLLILCTSLVIYLYCEVRKWNGRRKSINALICDDSEIMAHSLPSLCQQISQHCDVLVHQYTQL